MLVRLIQQGFMAIDCKIVKSLTRNTLSDLSLFRNHLRITFWR